MTTRKTRPPKPPTPAPRPDRPPRLRDPAEDAARLAAAPAPSRHAAGIDVGDATHWVCVDATPDGSDPVREFPAHTPGLRQLVAWLKALRGHHRRPGGQRGVRPRPVPHPPGGRARGGHDRPPRSPARSRAGRRPTGGTASGSGGSTSTACSRPCSSPTRPPRPCATTSASGPTWSGSSAQHVQRMQKALGLMNLKLTGGARGHDRGDRAADHPGHRRRRAGPAGAGPAPRPPVQARRPPRSPPPWTAATAPST